jgi:hypothetical protein
LTFQRLELGDCLFSYFVLFLYLFISEFYSELFARYKKGEKKIQRQQHYMMNTKEDGRKTLLPVDEQRQAFYVSVCLVLHCCWVILDRA